MTDMRCPKCLLEKAEACFALRGTVRRKVCKECSNAVARGKYLEDSAKAKASSLAYRRANRDLVNEKARKLKQENRLQRAQQRTSLVIKPSWKGPRALHDWHVRTWFALPKDERLKRRPARKQAHSAGAQCDAHVTRYRQVMRSREAYAVRYQAKPDAERARVRAYKEKLPDALVIEKLRLPTDWKHEVPKSLIDLKREQLLMRRLSRQLKEAAHHANQEQHESINQHS